MIAYEDRKTPACARLTSLLQVLGQGDDQKSGRVKSGISEKKGEGATRFFDRLH